MAGKSKFIKALNSINAYFDSITQKIFTEAELFGILEENRAKWDLAVSMFSSKFITELLLHTSLKEVVIHSEGQQSYTSEKITRYTYGEVSVFEIALSIKKHTHLSHYSSVFLHGLSQQIPKTIYVTFEQSDKILKDGVLLQSSIDNAFSKAQREPGHYYSYLDYRIILLNSKFTRKAGIIRLNSIFGNNLTITSLERTLIDITVRPAYSGGVNEVLKAYQAAKDLLSVNKLTSILTKMNFIYPYHQAIGFYLQNAGYTSFQTNMLKTYGFSYDFYLTYNMIDIDYSKEWHLYYPKNF